MLRIALIVIATLATASAALSVVSHYRPPGSLYTLTFAAFSPYLALAGVVGIVGFLLVRGRTGWIGAGVALALVVWQVVLQSSLFVATTAPDGQPITVMSANLRLGTGNAQDVVDAVRHHRVDLLMLVELTAPEQERLERDGLSTLLPYHSSDARGYGLGSGLWSRYPLRSAQTSRVLGFSLVTSLVDVPGLAAPLSAVSIHVFGPHPASQFPQWQSNMAQLPGVLRTVSRRGTQVVAGDFNATTDVAQFRAALVDGFADAAEQAGAGFVPTYPAHKWYGPLITIDHVLSRNAVATSVETITIRGSDHRALLARLVPAN